MKNSIPRTARGFSLIEVMIAVIVLAVGLLSLAALQGELFRAGAEAKARANAATIAQQVVEDARTFGFVLPPDADYEAAGFNTYDGLASDDWVVENVSGIDYTVERNVTRYRWDEVDEEFEANAVDAFALSVPEFKMVRVVVSWTDTNGNAKSVQMADSIAAIAPSDVTKVMEGPSESAAGPSVWIEPPNKDNPRVVPIAVGDDQSAASSNPTPEQFVDDVSNVTRFSVMSFTGAADATEVLLTRKLDVAAVSCVCEEGGESSASNPAYKPVIWNGVQLAYEEPLALPSDTPIGTAVVANADSEIEPLCTVCCRDHRNAGDHSPLPDPWRASEAGDTIATRYGYKAQGSSYDVSELLTTDETDGQYMDACQLVRVNGRMRMMVDAMQNSLVTTPLTSDGKDYQVTGFIDSYSGYVTTILAEGLGTTAAMPDGYPSPTVKFPAPSPEADTTYASIVAPPTIHFAADSATPVDLVSFGLYIDYLSEDTLLAYRCALNGDTDPDCVGLTERAPLDVLPFYAVNVASLGDWKEPASNAVATVTDKDFNNQGQLTVIGGRVTPTNKTSQVADGELVPQLFYLNINNSNSGLAGTSAVDLHDKNTANVQSDGQNFTRGTVATPPPVVITNHIYINVGTAYATNINSFKVYLNGTICEDVLGDKKSWDCEFETPLAAGATVKFEGYPKANANPDRLICIPDPTAAGSIVTSDAVQLETTKDETSTMTLQTLGSDQTMIIDAVNDATECADGRVPIANTSP